MALTTSPTSLKNQLNLANPNTLPSKLQQLKIGSLLNAMPTSLRQKAAVASPYVDPLTMLVVQVPEDAKANTIFRAYARAGIGVLAELAVMAPGTVPAAGQIAVAPNGDIATSAFDAWTNLDVMYLPEKYDVVEYTLDVVANVMNLPASALAAGVVLLTEAEAIEGGTTGKKIILSAGVATAPGKVALNPALTFVSFDPADLVTKARVKLGIGASVDVQALLEAESTSI
jgi:hypothetical protein